MEIFGTHLLYIHAHVSISIAQSDLFFTYRNGILDDIRQCIMISTQAMISISAWYAEASNRIAVAQ